MGKRHLPAPRVPTRALLGAAAALILLVVGSAAAQAQTREYQLRWRVPPEMDLASYRVFVGQAPGAYGQPFAIDADGVPPDASGVASTLLTGLDASRDYYVAMTALDHSGNESGMSNEVRIAAVPCSAAQCDDGNACTIDACGASACQHTAVPDGTGCNDGDATTFFDQCRAGICVGQRPGCSSDADCPDADANVCTGVQACVDFTCVATPPLACPAPTDACRAATCDPQSGCGFADAPNGSACDDGNASTFGDACANGVCVGTQAQCTSDAQCPDTDADPCNGKPVCQSFRCVAGPAAPDGTTCDDGDALSAGDVCTAGVCRGRHECDSDADCPDPDANLCTGKPVCSGFRCVAGAPPVCDGAPVCGQAACDPAAGCFVRYDPVGTPCDDGDASTQSDACVADGVCAGEVPPPPPPPDDACANAFGAPTAWRLALRGRPDREIRVVWDAPRNPAGAEVRFRRADTKRWFSVPGAVIRQSGCEATFAADLDDLRPDTHYDYAVSGPGASKPSWSGVKSFRTAPSRRSERSLRVVFVAGTGSPGAPDAAGAALVRDQIARLRPHLLLGGGGYAFSGDSIGAGLAASADAAVARWFAQMSPALAVAPFAPVLGDSEHAGDWHDEEASLYATRQPRPETVGAPPGSYSFDVGRAHFLALDAPTLGALLPDTAEGRSRLDWIDADLRAARRNARWLVVYLHADLWSSEAGAAGIGAVRDEIGRIFDAHGVDLVLSGDANSAERTRPLRAGEPVRRNRGVVYLRAGSGGRSAFGTWASPTPPPTTAMRDNRHAALVQLTFFHGDDDESGLRVTTLGIDPSSGRVEELDRTTIR
jgi:hypothetical protein